MPMPEDPSRVYEGWDDFEKALAGTIRRVQYIRIMERANAHGKDSQIGRFNICEESEDGQLQLAGFDSYEDAQTKATDFVRRKLFGNSIERPTTVFQVRFMGPKGGECLDSATITVVNQAAKALSDTITFDDKGIGPMMAPTTADGRAQGPFGQAMAELAFAYPTFLHMMMGGTRQLIGMFGTIITFLERRLVRAEEKNSELISTIAEQNRRRADAEGKAKAEEREIVAKEKIATEAIGSVKEFVEGYVSYREGVPPWLLRMVKPLAKNEAFASAMQDPAVVELLNDPQGLEKLAVVLQAIAARNKEEKQKSESSSDDPKTSTNTEKI